MARYHLRTASLSTGVEVDWAAQIAGSALYGEWQVAPAEGGIVVRIPVHGHEAGGVKTDLDH